MNETVQSPFAMFGTDKDLEKTGIDIDYGPFIVTVARAGGANTAFNNYLKQAMKPYRRQVENDMMSDEVAKKVMAEAYAATVILNWRTRKSASEVVAGVQQADGTIKPFSKEVVAETLLALPDLFSDLQEQAQKITNFRKADLVGDAKN